MGSGSLHSLGIGWSNWWDCLFSEHFFPFVTNDTPSNKSG